MAPPINNDASDEDSGEEDEADINRLSGNQLSAGVEASITRIEDGVIFKETLTEEQLTSQEISNGSTSATVRDKKRKPCRPISQGKKKIKSNNVEREWTVGDIQCGSLGIWEIPNWLTEEENNPVELFERFYDNEIIELIRVMTNLYAFQKGEHNLNLTFEEVRVFIGILLISGYNSVPRVKMYWEQTPDVNNQAISTAMSRNRFLQIMRYFHVCDNNDLDSDKFAKVSPLWQKLNERWLKYFHGEINLCVDEAMIPYFGRHSAKQHIHGKPIRFGYKAWCLCTRLGYLVQSRLYAGASTGNTNPELGVGGSVVADFAKILPEGTRFNFFFDNFFTSVKLLCHLNKSNCTGTGTVRNNRIENAPLTDVKVFNKFTRGSHVQMTDKLSKVTLVRYNDNNIVTVASTLAGVNPIGKTRRYSKAEKKYVSVDQPHCISLYNTYMGGVDRMDENISKLRINIRGKKWYWQLLIFPINVSVNNAWILYRLTGNNRVEPLDLLAFTRRISLTYVQKYNCRPSIGRPIPLKLPLDKRVTPEVRYDNEGHLITKNENQTRCGLCKKNSRMKCLKCNVGMHANCFVEFHKK